MARTSRTLVTAVAATMVLAGCATASDPVDPDAGHGSAGLVADADRTIEVLATAPFAFAPTGLRVEAGETITFEVTNDDAVDHDFVLGDEATQREHADEMSAMGDMEDDAHHDEPNAVTVPAGGTSTITWTFSDPGTVLYGCHEPGHYEAGMVGTITVEA